MKSYIQYVETWRDAVLASRNPDYGNMASVRKANRAVDKYRKNAERIGAEYPDKIEDFASLMKDADEEIRVIAAVCLVELMPHTKSHLDQAREIILERMSIAPEYEKMGWQWWLENFYSDF